MDMDIHEISSGGRDPFLEAHRNKVSRDQLRPLRRKLHYQPTCQCYQCYQCCQSKSARICYAALILALLTLEILVSLHFVSLENNAILGDASYNDIPTDNNNAHIIYPIHPKRNVTPYVELCEDCRLNPSAAGRPFVCYDRMLYLRDRKHLPEAKAREDVIKTNAEHCAMTRFPSPYNEEEYKAFDSMFSMWSTDNNGTRVVGGGDAVFNADSTSKTAKRGVGHYNNISIYIYETIPKDMGIDLEHKMAIQYASPEYKEQNFKADLAIIDLFRTYSGRIYDPAKADLLVVPFPHASHCLSSDGWWNECGHVKNEILQRGVLDNLPYYKGNEKRHLFINAQEIFHAHKLLRNVPLSLTLGPRVAPGDQGGGGGYQIVVPYLNDQRSFQPSAIRSRPKEWWTRPRKYSLAYFFGSQNRNMYGTSARIYRTYFLEEVQKNWNATSGEIGGLPYVIQNTGEVKSKNATARGGQFFSQMYGESVFCPTLPGDSPSQKRFFDVIVMGCIPVVLAFDTSKSSASVAGGFASNTSWHSPGGYPMGDVYPWAKGSNGTYPEEEIDYRLFVVEVHGGVGNVKPAIEALMENPREIRRRQLMLRKYAPYFCYGMGGDSHSYRDAFSKMMESVRFYLSSISSET